MTFLCRLVVLLLLAQSSFAKWEAPPQKADQYKRALIGEARHAFGLKAPISSFAAQIHQESFWTAHAESRVGAQGMAQFMPGTAKWIVRLYPELWPAHPYSPRWAIRAMVRYDRHLWDVVWRQHEIKPVDDCHTFAMVLSSYNGGSGWLDKRRKRSEHPGLCFDVGHRRGSCSINPGIKPSNQKENAGYSYRILKELEPRYLVHGWGRASCWVLN